MNWKLLFPSKYLKSEELRGTDYTLTIRDVQLEEVGLEGADSKKKGVVYFAETQKMWILNKTNGTALATMFGPETAGWVGKRVTIYPMSMTDSFTGEQITAIRVRGSPDLTASKQFEVKMPKRKPVRTVLQKTAANGQPPAKRQAAPGTVSSDPDVEPPDDVPLPMANSKRNGLQIQDDAPPPGDNDAPPWEHPAVGGGR